jgi:hypothetical protein
MILQNVERGSNIVKKMGANNTEGRNGSQEINKK